MVPSPFANLKSVTIFPAFLEGPEVTISSEVKNYLLDDSPNATFTMILHQLDRMKNSSRSNHGLAPSSPTSSFYLIAPALYSTTLSNGSPF
ncbi:hypothetical protein HanPSC8_Chr17g0751121 [Helianthus annuus]|nr:hypothetical protein HanPSC8_Chr17g0751121 [Helianthus annuus]